MALSNYSYATTIQAYGYSHKINLFMKDGISCENNWERTAKGFWTRPTFQKTVGVAVTDF